MPSPDDYLEIAKKFLTPAQIAVIPADVLQQVVKKYLAEQKKAKRKGEGLVLLAFVIGLALSKG